MDPSDTIYALASGGLPAGIAIVRVSGPRAREVCRSLIGHFPTADMRSLRRLSAPDGTSIDEGLVLFFPGPGSFTGENVLELQVHGSVAVVERLLDVLGELGLRSAEPGEFTRRAFENGRLDLTEIEGLSDLIAARTEAQRRQAVAQHGGALRKLYEDWSARLLHARAMIEAEFDFADEEDVPDDAGAGVDDELRRVVTEMTIHLAAGRQGEIVRDGFRIAILGPPNAGKSSLLNRMVEREAAIVTDIPGTTRDVVEVELQRKGMRIVVTDTAGIRATDDPIEAEGIRRAKTAGQNADLVIWLSPDGIGPIDPALDRAVIIRSKADQGGMAGPSISIRMPDGLRDLWTVIDERLDTLRLSSREGDAIPTRARHREGVSEALRHIERALGVEMRELKAENLRLAAHALARVTGRVDVEDLLGVIFSEFCVGK